MRIRVLFFASHRDRAGRGSLDLVLGDGATAADAVRTVGREVPGLPGLSGSVAVAVNERYASSGTVLRDGDVVALIPPVAGG